MCVYSRIVLYTHILGKKLAGRDDLDHDLKLVAEESQRCKLSLIHI